MDCQPLDEAAHHQMERWEQYLTSLNKSLPHHVNSQQLATQAAARAKLSSFVDAVSFESTTV